MSSKDRLCVVCGRWVPTNEDLVLIKEGGAAHLGCAWLTRNQEKDSEVPSWSQQ